MANLLYLQYINTGDVLRIMHHVMAWQTVLTRVFFLCLFMIWSNVNEGQIANEHSSEHIRSFSWQYICYHFLHNIISLKMTIKKTIFTHQYGLFHSANGLVMMSQSIAHLLWHPAIVPWVHEKIYWTCYMLILSTVILIPTRVRKLFSIKHLKPQSSQKLLC